MIQKSKNVLINDILFSLSDPPHAIDPHLDTIQRFMVHLNRQLSQTFGTVCKTTLNPVDDMHHRAVFLEPTSGRIVADYTWSFDDNLSLFEDGLRQAFYAIHPEGSPEQQIQHAAAFACDMTFTDPPLADIPTIILH